MVTTSRHDSGYARGLHEIGDNLFAYLLPPGGWGWSNSGLIVGDGASLLVDTLIDLKLTREMLDAIKPMTAASPLQTVVNTHGDGDHCWGNQLVGDGVEIVASNATAREMPATPPSMVATLIETLDYLTPEMQKFTSSAFGGFEFDGIELVPPTSTFDDRLSLSVGGRRVELMEVGPAHTAGDVVAWLPDDKVLYSGDVLFARATPVVWAGPARNWAAACARIAELEPELVVPGHGPLSSVDDVLATAEYFDLLERGVRARHDAGMALEEAVRDLDREIDSTRFAEWQNRERIEANVRNIWAEIEPDYPQPSQMDLFMAMAGYAPLGPAPRRPTNQGEELT